MSTAVMLFLAMLLDAVLGEPKWLWQRIPHPATLMGQLIELADTRWNHGDHQRISGILTVIGLCLLMGVVGLVITAIGDLFVILVAAMLLAQRSLVQHVGDVANALRISLGDGRMMVGRIVSRDTRDMDQSAVTRSAIESAAENLSDGVVAPAFWFLIGGLPGLLIYKVVNTADSMIGYRTPRHEAFGKAAARLDDLLNLIPARLTALLIALTHGGLRAWTSIRSDASKHRSPNAGWPEAAMARALNAAIAGPRIYDGVKTEFAFVNPDGRHHLGPTDIDAAVSALWKTWGLVLAIVGIVSLF